MKRRALLSFAATLAVGRSAAAKPLESAELSLHELHLAGDTAFGRYLLAVPKTLPRSPELLVLLHGLGETVEQRMGARAFAERYGLLEAVARLAHPPLERTLPKVDYFGEGRLEELSSRLLARPYRCPVLLCPFTPNPYKAGGDALVARFARFVAGPLKSSVEQRLNVTFPPSRCMLSGVSLGGYLALELFLNTPEQYVGVGTAQGAFGPQQAARYAASIASSTERVGRRRVEILTSSSDPYRPSNEAFHRHLLRHRQASRLRVSPGPHDQRWLRESGVIEMLVAADDVFSERRAEGAP
jgi:pimeloyl-ACP methyl ester carboxylesterase